MMSQTERTPAFFKSLEKSLGIKFRKRILLEQALTHSSRQKTTKNNQVFNNERLEFFGDAVLKLVVSDHLFAIFPDYSEGDLTKIRARVVSDAVLARVAAEIKLGSYIDLGFHEIKAQEYNRPSILAAALEALFGAIFLDRGLGAAKKLIIKLLQTHLEEARDFQNSGDYKSKLQEESQSRGWPLPDYRVVRVSGPEHQKSFYIEVTAGGRGSQPVSGSGHGRSKKTAEQFAARAALEKLSKFHE